MCFPPLICPNCLSVSQPKFCLLDTNACQCCCSGQRNRSITKDQHLQSDVPSNLEPCHLDLGRVAQKKTIDMIDIWRLDHCKILLQAIDARDGYDKNLPREKKTSSVSGVPRPSQSHQMYFRMPLFHRYRYTYKHSEPEPL